MAPFEALYGRKCRTPLNWIEPGKRRYYGIDIVKEDEEQVRIIQQHNKVGDFVYLKVSPMKKVQRFGVKQNLHLDM